MPSKNEPLEELLNAQFGPWTPRYTEEELKQQADLAKRKNMQRSMVATCVHCEQKVICGAGPAKALDHLLQGTRCSQKDAIPKRVLKDLHDLRSGKKKSIQAATVPASPAKVDPAGKPAENFARQSPAGEAGVHPPGPLNF